MVDLASAGDRKTLMGLVEVALFACIKEMQTPALHNSTIKSCSVCTSSEHPFGAVPLAQSDLRKLHRRGLGGRGRVLQGVKLPQGMKPPGPTSPRNSWELTMISTLPQQPPELHLNTSRAFPVVVVTHRANFPLQLHLMACMTVACLRTGTFSSLTHS